MPQGLSDATKKPNAFVPVLVTIGTPNDASGLSTVILDASLREVHERTSKVTKYPIETGANPADHARPDPNVVKIKGIVSQTPEYTQSQSETRVAEARKTLIGFRDNVTLVEISTNRDHYTSMVITSIVEPIEPDGGLDFQFELTAEQLLTANSAVVPAPVPKKPSGSKQVSLGPKVPTADTNLQSGFSAAVQQMQSWFSSSTAVP